MPNGGGSFRVEFPSGGRAPDPHERRERMVESVGNKGREHGAASASRGGGSSGGPAPSAAERRPPTSSGLVAPPSNLMFGNYADAQVGAQLSYPGGSAGVSWSEQDATVYELEMESASLFESDFSTQDRPLGDPSSGFVRPGGSRARLSVSGSARAGLFVGFGSRRGFAAPGTRASLSFTIHGVGVTVGYQSSADASGNTFAGVFGSIGTPGGGPPAAGLSATQTRLGPRQEVLDLRLDHHIQQWVQDASGQPWTDAM